MIADFRFNYRWLSNFHVCDIEYEGVMYKSSEHAYQAAKTDVPEERERIRRAPEPKDAKRLGRSVTLRPDWDQIKDFVMMKILLYKFTHHLDLKQKLLDTGNHTLVEGNWWNDTYWGVCNGVGQNKLGKMLMQIRERIK